jgi:hypothetical protein
LAKLGVIEHISNLNARYNGQHGWKLSTKFAFALRQLAQKWADLKNTNVSSLDRNLMMIEFTTTKCKIGV